MQFSHICDLCLTNFFVCRKQTSNVLNELRKKINELANTSRPIYAHFPVEVRFVDSSDIYLSPTQGRTSAYINIICYRPYRQVVEHKSYWKLYESILKPVGGRPHWAKAHRETANDFVKMYPLFRKWIQVRNRADPTKMFYNAYMERIFESNDSIHLDLPMNFFSPNSSVNGTSTPVNLEQAPEQGVENNVEDGQGDEKSFSTDSDENSVTSTPLPVETKTRTEFSSMRDPETELK